MHTFPGYMKRKVEEEALRSLLIKGGLVKLCTRDIFIGLFGSKSSKVNTFNSLQWRYVYHGQGENRKRKNYH